MVVSQTSSINWSVFATYTLLLHTLLLHHSQPIHPAHTAILILPQITSFGYTEEQSLLYGIPGGAVEIVALLLSGYIGQYTGQRILCSVGGLVASIVGMVLIVALPLSNNVGRLIGYYMTQASPTPFVALLSLISSNVAGYTKKTTVAALYLIGYCAGNIIGKSPPPTKHQGENNGENNQQTKLTSTTQAPKPSARKTPPATSPPKSPSSSAGASVSCSWVSSGGGTTARIRRRR